MTSALRHHRYGRALGAGVLSVALLSGGTAGAFAATSTPSPTPTMTGTTTPSPTPTMTGTTTPSPTPTMTGTTTPSPTPTMTRTGMPTMTHTGMPTMRPPRTPSAMRSITASADRRAVRVGNTVVFTGRVTGVKAGETLVLQHKRNGRWTSLKTTATVSKNGTYRIRRTFTNRGTEQVRVATRSGTVHSSPITVKVR